MHANNHHLHQSDPQGHTPARQGLLVSWRRYVSYKYGGSTQQGRGDYVETVFGSNGQQIGVRGEPVWLLSCRTLCLNNNGLELTIRMIRCMHIADMAV